MNRIGIVAVLAVAWTALWRDASPGTVLAGLAVGSAVSVAAGDGGTPAWRPLLRPVAMVRFVVAFLWNLTTASVAVAWDVVTPEERVREAIVLVPLRTGSDAIVTTVANAISLTPGTVTVDVERDPIGLYIHVMHFRDADHARSQVRRLEELAIRAFGSRDEVARLDGDTGDER
ncbi:MAG: Na+/H+ antiporter subunit E [Actinomycetota bacterium]|nr:Na+/H+ antiporter subunit E [Actinomycetota bacterium]